MEYFNAHPAWWWLSLGLALLIIEMLSGTLIFLFVSVGAFLVALLTWGLNLSAVAQGLLFALATVAAVAAWRKFRPNPGDRVEQLAGAVGLNDRLSGFVGREAVLEEAISQGRGRVRLDDSYWSVVGDDAPAGARVRVEAIEGMILRVRAI